MITGTFRDGHPWVQLTLEGPGGPLSSEFVVDTGFDGDLALPGHLVRQIGGAPGGMRDRALANGAIIRCLFYDMEVEWDGQMRTVEVLVLEGNPLIGTHLLLDYLLQVENTERGEVLIEPL